MRRPVKPFVTEYKASNRRLGGRSGEDLFTVPGSGEPAPRRSSDAAAHGENAYEAAMKAADAIFSPAADRSREVADAPASARGEPPVEGADAPAAAGRILRAIEEPPPPEVAEFEEPPRRRGRKPGSKNKPKFVAAAPAAPRPAPFQQDSDSLELEEDEGEEVAALSPPPVRASVPLSLAQVRAVSPGSGRS